MIVPAMWSVWGLLVLLSIALKIYSGRLSRDEDDQLVLDESFAHVRAEQAAIMSRVKKVEPVMRTVLVLLAAMTLVVVAYYVVDMIHQFQ